MGEFICLSPSSKEFPKICASKIKEKKVLSYKKDRQLFKHKYMLTKEEGKIKLGLKVIKTRIPKCNGIKILENSSIKKRIFELKHFNALVLYK